jgi:hypothetical protein
MTFIKTFEAFKNQSSQVSEKAISGGSVTKETPKSGELARFTVVLKATGDNDTISDANPAQSALDHLVNNQEFKTWYSDKTTSADAAGQPFTSLNSTSIAFVETGKHRQAGFLKREKATETFIFKRIGSASTTDKNMSELNYDVKKFPAQAKSNLSSGGTVYAWNAEQEKDMTLSPSKKMQIALNDLTVDAAMKDTTSQAGTQAASSSTASSSGTQGSAGTSGTSAVAASTSSTAAQSPSYVGLKKSSTFDQKVQDLQKTIIAKGGTAADTIKTKGGSDGKYGAATASAIGSLIGTNKEENEITADIDAKLKTALAGVTVPASTGQTSASNQQPKKQKSGGGVKPLPAPAGGL